MLHGVSFAEYVRADAALGHQRLRTTYDRGRWELTPRLMRRERATATVRRLIDAYALFAGVSIQCVGSATMRSERLNRSMEPDVGYYVRTPMPPLKSVGETLDPTVLSPPDLVIETDSLPRQIDRLSILAAFGVAEVLRYDGERLASLHLQAYGGYVEQAWCLALPALPALPPARLDEWLRLSFDAGGQNAALDAMRAWLRERADSLPDFEL